MKKLLLFAICTIFYSSYAQLPPNSFGEDFTLTDVNGNEFNLHSTLDEGKTVILDLFATWCGPCWSYAESGVLEDLQAAYPDDVVVVAVEADPSTPASEIYNSDLGDWTSVIDYIMADDPSANGDIANDYALAYYPTIYKICPDRMVTEVGQLSSVNAFYSEIGSCSSATYSKDARMLSYNGDDTYCDGNLSASVTIQNYSVGATLSACDILTKSNGNTINTTSWSGSLDTYETATVDLGTITGITNGANISFEINYSGDMDASNNDISPSISGSEESSVYVRLNLLLDNYPTETSWQLFNSSGVVVESTNVVGQAYGQAGDYSADQANTLITEEWVLSNGCYKFQVYDAYGDGLAASQWSGTDGSVELLDYANNITFWTDNTGADWEIQVGGFNAGALASLEDVAVGEMSIYPNPSNDNINIYINSNSTNNVTVEIYNNLGKVIYSELSTLSNGSNNTIIDVSNFTPGLYYVNAIINGENNIKPLNIIK